MRRALVVVALAVTAACSCPTPAPASPTPPHTNPYGRPDYPCRLPESPYGPCAGVPPDTGR